MTRQVTAGNVKIGGDAPISVQSMLNIPAHDIEGSVKQAIALENAGCEIIRVAVPDEEAVKTVAANHHKKMRCHFKKASHFLIVIF